MRLKDKSVIVTGGGSGFGEGIVKRFSDEGARIVVADINEENGKRVVAGVNNSIFCKADVSHEPDVKRMIDLAVDTFGKLDILVNNAGIAQKNCSMTEVTEDLVSPDGATSGGRAGAGMEALARNNAVVIHQNITVEGKSPNEQALDIIDALNRAKRNGQRVVF